MRRIVASDPGWVEAAQRVLEGGGLLAYPTETFYGLGVHPRAPGALEALAAVKGRGGQIPLVASDVNVVRDIAVVPPALSALADAFWPGPLTLVLVARQPFPEAILGPGNTLAVRVSSAPWPTAIAASIGGLVTSTSANPKGGPPPQSADGLDEALWEHVAAVVDGGATPGGLPSTVVGEREGRVCVFRRGAVKSERLESVLGYAPADAVE